MSFVDRLFPQAELEALGNKWHEPAPKRRKLVSGTVKIMKGGPQSQRRETIDACLRQRQHRLSVPTPRKHGRQLSLPELTPTRTTKRSNSDSQPLLSPSGTKSCLPSFIEPSLLKNYLRHLHPKDSRRYTLSDSPHTIFPGADNAVSSPGSLVPDSTHSPASTDSCPTPATVCEQFRSGPFGHLFDGMRLTDNERDLMEDLLSPLPASSLEEASSPKRKYDDVRIEPHDNQSHNYDELLLRSIFPDSGVKQPGDLHLGTVYPVKIETASSVHSSGLSPATEEQDDEEEEVISHRGIAIYDYSALSSVDDFFDLDEAST